VSTWTLVAADATTAANLGELPDATSVTAQFGLNTPTTLGFTLPLRSTYADTLLGGSGLVKLYQTTASGKYLRAVTEVVTVEEVGTEDGQQTIAVQCMCAGSFRLLHRLVGKSATGYSQTSPRDRGLIAQDLITRVNATTGTDGGGYTGVRLGKIGQSSVTTVLPAWRYQSVLEAVTGLGAALDGFDWEILPVDGESETAGITVGEFVAVSVIGRATDVVFEYGGGRRNVRDYRRQVNRQGIATTVYSLPQSYGDTTGGTTGGVVTKSSASPAVTGSGRHEVLLSSPVTSDALRSSVASVAVAVRSVPQQVVQFTPSLGAYEYGTDYAEGDTVGVRVRIEDDTRLDATVRVYGVAVALDDVGRETITLTLTPETLTS